MLRPFLKIAFRHYWRHKFYTSLNLLGLIIGYTTFAAIGLYLHYETSFETFHDKADRIYRASHYTQNAQGESVEWARTYFDFINELPVEIPEIAELIRFQNHQSRYIRIGTHKFAPEFHYTTDSSVFKVFNFELLDGDPRTALKEPHSMVLTESLARKYFPDTNPVGQTVDVMGSYTSEAVPHTITGIMRDLPAHTHMPVEVLFSFESAQARSWWAYVYILLKPGNSIEEVEAKMGDFMAKFHEPQGAGKAELHFMPLREIHLQSNLARELVPNGDMLYVRIIAWAGLFLLLIALINSLNMSSALAMGRTKEIGMHLVMGASSTQLRRFAIFESSLYHLIAATLSLGLLALVLPSIEQILSFSPILAPELTVGIMLLVALLAGLLVGIYPSRVLTRASLQQVFLGKGRTGQAPQRSAMRLRHVLIGLQFTAAVLLMSSAWVSAKQVQFLQDKNLGLNPHQVLALPALANPVTDRYPAFRDRVASLPGVTSVSACMEVPSREIRDTGPTLVVGRDSDPTMAAMLDMQVISSGFLETLDIQLLAGEDRTADYRFTAPPQFSETYSPATYLNERPRKYMVNETAMRKLGFQSPAEAIGQQIQWSIGGFELAAGPITGVVTDVHQETLKNRVDPTIMVVEQIWLRTILLKLQTEEMDETLATVQAAWDELFPSYPFKYVFLDEAYARLYQQERQQLRLLLMLTTLSVVVALIGLFSLVAFALRMRMQEFAIRRILGAQEWHLLHQISRQYLIALLIGGAIALPASYYLVQQWLQTFAYQAPASNWPYLLTLAILGCLVLMAIGIQVWRSTRANPSEILREG